MGNFFQPLFGELICVDFEALKLCLDLVVQELQFWGEFYIFEVIFSHFELPLHLNYRFVGCFCVILCDYATYWRLILKLEILLILEILVKFLTSSTF